MIAKCPKCDEQVQLPPGLAGESKVRCPLCQEEYALSVALEKLPPALIVLEAVSAAPAPTATDLGTGTAAAGEEGEYSLAAAGELLGELDAAEASAAATPAFAPRSGDARGTTIRASARPKPPPVNPVKELVKVVLGGGVGLFLAQLLLWWLPGEWRRDPFNLAPKVAQYPAARFLLPQSYWPRGEANGDQEADPFEQSAGTSEPMKNVPSGAGILDGSKTDWNKVIQQNGKTAPGDDAPPPKKSAPVKSPEDDLKLDPLDNPTDKKPEKAPDLGLDDLSDSKPAPAKTEEPKAKTDEPKAKADEPKAEEPKPKTDEPKAEAGKPTEPKPAEPKSEEPKSDPSSRT
ncbi:MAG: hypothetical protein ACKOBW_05870 [Planctomycetota bacterium]